MAVLTVDPFTALPPHRKEQVLSYLNEQVPLSPSAVLPFFLLPLVLFCPSPPSHFHSWFKDQPFPLTSRLSSPALARSLPLEDQAPHTLP